HFFFWGEGLYPTCIVALQHPAKKFELVLDILHKPLYSIIKFGPDAGRTGCNRRHGEPALNEEIG
ncbi:MAG: hypothetical protein ACI4MK_14160, partial [Aristaeellaceae bacterium]